MAGKRVRCKQCGHIFELPGVTLPEAGPDLDALVEMERSFHSLEASTAMGEPPPAEADSEQDPAYAGPARKGRASVRFKHPFAKEIDTYLPLVLTSGSLIWLGIESFRLDDSGVPWLAALRLAVALLAFVLFIGPITLATIRRAGRALGYQMPVTDRWRTFSTYLPAFALGYVMWLTGHGSLVGLVMGCLVGVVVATLPLWLLFRLRPQEIAPTACYAAAGFGIGLAIACGLVFGMNRLTVQVLAAMKQADVLPGSPFARGLEWVQPSPQVVKTDGPGAQPAPRDPSPIPPSAPPHGIQASGKPDEAASQRAPRPPAIRPPQPPDRPPDLPAVDSPIVASAELAPIPAGFDDVIRPVTDSAYLAVVRGRGGNNSLIEVWDADTWTRHGSAPFSNAPGASSRYALSPDGRYVARIVKFPRLSVQVWSFDEERAISVDLSVAPATPEPELVGFTSNSRLLVRSQVALELSDVSTGQRLRKIETPACEPSDRTLAISPDGSLAAVAARERNYPALVVYSLDTGQVVSRARITSLDPQWSVLPTGMAFSPDSAQVACLFEQDGNGLLVCYRTDNGARVADHVYPSVPWMGRNLHSLTGNALAWLPDGRSWLLYGQSIFDTKTGRMVAELPVAAVESCRVISPDMVELTGVSPTEGKRQVTLLRLNMPKLGELLSEQRR